MHNNDEMKVCLVEFNLHVQVIVANIRCKHNVMYLVVKNKEKNFVVLTECFAVQESND